MGVDGVDGSSCGVREWVDEGYREGDGGGGGGSDSCHCTNGPDSLDG